VLPKPFDVELVAEAVNRVLESVQRAAQEPPAPSPHPSG
jgi:hypothetical protein